MTASEILPFVPLIAAAPVMVTAGWFDIRFLRIPNVLSLILVAAFVLFSLAYPPEDLIWRLAAAGGVFLVSGNRGPRGRRRSVPGCRLAPARPRSTRCADRG